jgi:hypothetical protein
MAAAEESGVSTWLDVAAAVQRETCGWLGVPAPLGQEWMQQLRAEDADFGCLSMYRRHNRATAPSWQPRDAVGGLLLRDLAGRPAALGSGTGRPCIVVSGSLS